MTKILYIDASSERAVVALKSDNFSFTKELPVGRDSSAQMAEVVQELLDEAPGAVAYGEGPGSYTGLRVAAALASALSLSYKIPLVKVSALHGYHSKNSYAVLLDARSGGVYTLFDGEIRKMTIEEAAEKFCDVKCLFSPHASVLKERLPKLAGEWIEKAIDAQLIFPLIEKKLENGDFTLKGEPELNYL